MRVFFLVSTGLLLTGCVSSSKPLKNASGTVVECKAIGFGWLGAPVAMIAQSDCVRDMKRKGFFALDKDPNDLVLPRNAVEYASMVSISLPNGWTENELTSHQKKQSIRISATNTNIDGGMMISAIKRSAVTDVGKYISSRRSAAKSAGVNVEVSEAEVATIGVNEAYRYTSKNLIDIIKIRYIYTVIIGKDEIVMITSWTTEGNFDNVKQELISLADRIQGI
jgi:hypothetical protein